MEGYKIYKNGVEIATTTETTYTDTSVKMGDVYNYKVKAYDISDNLSDPSDIVTVDYNDTVDTDGDGLADYLENTIGTNIIKADTDGDGLTDRYEHIILGTDPLLLDTDGDGISDADEDADGDGLTNKDEAAYGTDPLYEDTDGDGLNDNDEVKVYFTDPLLSDTDGEGLSDDDEITLGFDPLNPDTDDNGITDANEKVNQTLNVSIEEDEKPGITGVSVTMNGTGNINDNTSIDNVYGIDTLSSDVVGLIGVPVEITSDSQFDEATIRFHYDDRFLGDTKEEDLAVMWYDEENNAYQILDADTVIDTANNTVSYTTTHFSTYMVVDRQKWYDVWSNAITYRRDPEIPGIPVEYFDISFVVDKSGSMSGSNIEKAKDAISSFIDAFYSNDRGSIVAFDSGAIVGVDFTSDKTVLKNALNSIEASGGTSVNAGLLKAISLYDGSTSPNSKMIILLCDGDVNCTQDTIQKAIDSNIKIYPVLIGSMNSSSALESIASQTGGTFYYAATAEDIRKAIYGIQEGAMLDTTDTDGDGLYDIYETAGMMLPNGQIVYSDSLKKDTDSDKLSDFLEMGGIEEFDNENLIKQYIMTKEGYDNTIYATYFNYVSNPNLSDTDNDGVNDYDDAYGTDSTKSMDDDELTGTYQYFIDLANENYENRSYIYMMDGIGMMNYRIILQKL
ncbi:MAG: VWA domain-containing protein [Anaerocolumna sp.]